MQSSSIFALTVRQLRAGQQSFICLVDPAKRNGIVDKRMLIEPWLEKKLILHISVAEADHTHEISLSDIVNNQRQCYSLQNGLSS